MAKNNNQTKDKSVNLLDYQEKRNLNLAINGKINLRSVTKFLSSKIRHLKRKINKLLNGSKANDEKEDDILLCEKMSFTGREAYKMLRTNLSFMLADSHKCKKIGVTSSIRGEGKSTVSINLAYTISSANSKVLLIDLDMRLPSVAKKLKIDYRLGLSDYLVGNAKTKDIIHSLPNYDNFDVILSGTIPPNPSELIGSENLASFVKSIENSYDYIIFDLPPVNIVTDALAAKDLLDGELVVVRECYSNKYSLANCIRQLEFVEMNILGFVLTNVGGEATYYNKYTSNYRYKKGSKYSHYSDYRNRSSE